MDVKTTFRNLVRDQSVSICMLHPVVAGIPTLTDIPAVAGVFLLAAVLVCILPVAGILLLQVSLLFFGIPAVSNITRVLQVSFF